MARIYITHIEFVEQTELDEDNTPDRLFQAKIDHLMELLDIDEQQATSFLIRGYYTCG